MKGFVRAAVALGLWAGSWSPASAAAGEAVIARVLDGVTLETSTGETVRLIGIGLFEFASAPALNDRYRAEAIEFTTRRVQGRAVRLEVDEVQTDRQGRRLAYVWTDSMLLNEDLIRAGLAEVRAHPPNLHDYARFAATQRQAVRDRRGVWGRPELMDIYGWTPGGVIGRSLMPIFYHHADPELDRLPFGERHVYFDNPAEAARHGFAPSLDYSRWEALERQRLVGERLTRTDIPAEVLRGARIPAPQGVPSSAITSVSGPEVFGLGDGSTVRLDGIEVVEEGRRVVQAWKGRAVVYTATGPASLGVLPVVLWVNGSLAQADLIAEGVARLSERAARVFGEANDEKLMRLEAAARAARLGAWRRMAPLWKVTYASVLLGEPPSSEEQRAEARGTRDRGDEQKVREEAAQPRASPTVFLRPVFQVVRIAGFPFPIIVREVPVAVRQPAPPAPSPAPVCR